MLYRNILEGALFMAEYIFLLNNLNCANCAKKIENKINQSSLIQKAVFSFTTKKLVVNSNCSAEQLLISIQEICDSIEDGVTVEIFQNNKAKKSNGNFSHKKDIIKISCGVALFICAIVFQNLFADFYNNALAIIFYIMAYIILGGKVLVRAVKNISKGNIFTENFLMSIATLGAFAIGEFSEAVGVMLFFNIGELFEKIAVQRSKNQIINALDLRPEQVNIIKDDEIITIPSENANVNDIILVRPGDRIPLDGTIMEGNSQLDTSAVTGESIPISVCQGNEIMSGCVNISGVLKVRVDKVLKGSMVSRILDSVENATANKPKIDSFITRFSRIYTPIVVAIALITAFVIPFINGYEFLPWIYTAISFLVMSCPCALVLSVPLAFFSGIGAGSKKGILFKGGLAIEAIGKIKAVAMDKTGTITKGSFEIQEIVPVDLSRIDHKYLLQLCATCEQASTHPIAKSICDYGKNNGVEILRADNIQEIKGKGIKAVFDNKTVLCGSEKLLNDNGVDLTKYSSSSTGTQVLVAVDGIFAGHLTIADSIKNGAKETIKKLKEKHIFTSMLTGDREVTANAVGKEIGIEKVYSKLLPQDKLSAVQDIRKEYGNVMFIGDGINDTPVLAGADVGCAMGSGADSAIEIADIVFMNSNIEAIPEALDIAKRTNIISKQNVIFALAIKFIVIILGVTGIYSSMWLAVFADTGVAMLCILNSIRLLFKYRK